MDERNPLKQTALPVCLFLEISSDQIRIMNSRHVRVGSYAEFKFVGAVYGKHRIIRIRVLSARRLCHQIGR